MWQAVAELCGLSTSFSKAGSALVDVIRVNCMNPECHNSRIASGIGKRLGDASLIRRSAAASDSPEKAVTTWQEMAGRGRQ